MRPLRSLRVELAAALALVLMMAVVSLSLASEMLAQRRHVGQEEERLREHAAGLALVLSPMLGNAAAAGDLDEVEQLLRPSIGSLGIAAIEIHREQGGKREALVELGLPPELAPPESVDDPEGIARREGGWLVVDRPIRTFGPDATRPRLWLRLVARPSTWSTLGDWREIAVVALGVGLVSFVLGVLLLDLQVLRPLARLRARTADVGKGDLAARVEIDGPAELQELASAFNDMTEKLATHVRENEAQAVSLARAEQLASLGRIAAGTAHEVGNPLATVLGYVELLLDARTDPPLHAEHREMLERVREQILRIRTLVAQLLEYSRPVRIQASDVELLALARRVVALVRHDARCADVELSIEGDEAVAHADPMLLEQVVQNLVVNAARSARAGAGAAKVQIRVASRDTDVVIEVHDSGAGVPAEVRAHLFEPFVTTAKAGEGTGLGLAISLGLVERMGGALECTDERSAIGTPGSPGAVFRVTLPRAQAGAPPRANALDQASVQGPIARAEPAP